MKNNNSIVEIIKQNNEESIKESSNAEYINSLKKNKK